MKKKSQVEVFCFLSPLLRTSKTMSFQHTDHRTTWQKMFTDQVHEISRETRRQKRQHTFLDPPMQFSVSFGAADYTNYTPLSPPPPLDVTQNEVITFSLDTFIVEYILEFLAMLWYEFILTSLSCSSNFIHSQGGKGINLQLNIAIDIENPNTMSIKYRPVVVKETWGNLF